MPDVKIPLGIITGAVRTAHSPCVISAHRPCVISARRPLGSITGAVRTAHGVPVDMAPNAPRGIFRPLAQGAVRTARGVPVASRSIWRQMLHALSAPLHEALGAIPTGTPPGRHGKHLRGVRGLRLIGVRGILYAKIKYILIPISMYHSLLSAYTPSFLFGDAAHSCQQGRQMSRIYWLLQVIHNI